MMEKDKDADLPALLVMDIQPLTVKMFPENSRFLDSLTKVVEAARNRQIPVIFVVIGFRKGYPEISARNKSFLF